MFKSIFGRVLAVMARTSGLLVSVFLVAMPGVPRAQQKMDSYDRDRAETFLRDAYDAVKKHYYDPKFHGVDLDARFKDYEQKIGAATTFSQSFGLVAGFLDGLQDTHTYFEPPARPYRVDYGFRMHVVGDTCYITQVRPGTDAALKVHPGDQVIAYNNFAVNRTDFHEMTYFFSALSPQKASILDLRNPEGQEQKLTVDAKVRELKKVLDFASGMGGGVDIWDTIREEENFDRLMRQRYVEMGDVMIWKMPEFFMDDNEIDHLFGIAKKHKALILDLRGNPGGAIDTLERVVGNVFDHDVKIADRIGRKESKPQLAKTRGGSAFAGKIIVLVDSSSASCSELLSRVMQLEHRGTVIGDRSAGAVMEARGYPYSQGMGTMIFFGFSVTDANLIMKDGKSLEHEGVTPDEIILPTARDLAADRDPVLARAAELAGVNLEPAAAAKLFPVEWRPE